jgi:hypothetical protein
VTQVALDEHGKPIEVPRKDLSVSTCSELGLLIITTVDVMMQKVTSKIRIISNPNISWRYNTI